MAFQAPADIYTLFALVEVSEEEIHIRVFKVVSGLFNFVLVEDVTVSDFAEWAIGPDQIVNRFHALPLHC